MLIAERKNTRHRFKCIWHSTQFISEIFPVNIARWKKNLSDIPFIAFDMYLSCFEAKQIVVFKRLACSLIKRHSFYDISFYRLCVFKIRYKRDTCLEHNYCISIVHIRRDRLYDIRKKIWYIQYHNFEEKYKNWIHVKLYKWNCICFILYLYLRLCNDRL